MVRKMDGVLKLRVTWHGLDASRMDVLECALVEGEGALEGADRGVLGVDRVAAVHLDVENRPGRRVPQRFIQPPAICTRNRAGSQVYPRSISGLSQVYSISDLPRVYLRSVLLQVYLRSLPALSQVSSISGVSQVTSIADSSQCYFRSMLFQVYLSSISGLFYLGSTSGHNYLRCKSGLS